MKVIGLVGWSGSGKTTLIVSLIPVLRSLGIRVSTLKHAHHDFDIDHPGKDSYEHRAAGASEVLVSSSRRWALVHEHNDMPEPSLDELLTRLSPTDLVIIEGFKRHQHDKIEIHRKGVRELLAKNDDRIIAVASDEPLNDLNIPNLDLNDVESVADFMVTHCSLNTHGNH